MSTQTELRASALHALSLTDPTEKCGAVKQLFETQPQTICDVTQALMATQTIPGRPNRPSLIPPTAVERRSMRTVEGRAALIHALAHIEFNAINLALDAVWRFENMPENYYTDWLKVAAEEAYHFSLLNAHLNSFGFTYGDF